MAPELVQVIEPVLGSARFVGIAETATGPGAVISVHNGQDSKDGPVQAEEQMVVGIIEWRDVLIRPRTWESAVFAGAAGTHPSTERPMVLDLAACVFRWTKSPPLPPGQEDHAIIMRLKGTIWTSSSVELRPTGSGNIWWPWERMEEASRKARATCGHHDPARGTIRLEEDFYRAGSWVGSPRPRPDRPRHSAAPRHLNFQGPGMGLLVKLPGGGFAFPYPVVYPPRFISEIRVEDDLSGPR